MSTKFLTPAILLARRLLYERGDWTPEAATYVREQSLDLDLIAARAGLFTVVLAQLTGHNTGVPRWDFEPDGAPAAVVEVLAEDGCTVADLVAWPLNAPERFATAVGEADMLGINAMRNPATYWAGVPLRVHRTPLNWLKAGCDGCVILNRAWGGYWLSRCPGPIMAEDLAHGRELRRLLPNSFDMRRLLVPVDTERAAA